jgi:hypothetical protein
MVDNVVRHPAQFRHPKARSYGEIFVWPSDRDGGSWGVHFEAPTGQIGDIGFYLSLDQAVTAARAAAVRSGAYFNEGGDAA